VKVCVPSRQEEEHKIVADMVDVPKGAQIDFQ
jgi:hypothetical protein